MKTDRLLFYDILKAYAIFLVVLGHVIQTFNPEWKTDNVANSTSKCKITKCFCKSTPLVLRNSISFLVSH